VKSSEREDRLEEKVKRLELSLADAETAAEEQKMRGDRLQNELDDVERELEREQTQHAKTKAELQGVLAELNEM
jgi:septal ring factor EnvC (AmiA/AmiB activator)